MKWDFKIKYWILNKPLTWQHDLLYNLSKLDFATGLIKLISSFRTERIFRVSVEGEMSTPRHMQAGVPQGSILSPRLYNLYINNTPQTYDVHLALFAVDITERGLCSEKTPEGSKLNGDLVWALEYKINEDKTRTINFCYRITGPDFLLTLNGRDIPFVNSVKGTLTTRPQRRSPSQTYRGHKPVRSGDAMRFLWGTDKPIDLNWVLNKRIVIVICITSTKL
jgi:hypothetical protein